MEPINEGLYLVKLREFVNSREQIYKIGRSHNIFTRINQYPNGTKVYVTNYGANSVSVINTSTNTVVNTILSACSRSLIVSGTHSVYDTNFLLFLYLL